MGKKGILILAVALLLSTNFVFAETSEDKVIIVKELKEKTKLAFKEDVVGEWEMVWQTKAASLSDDDPLAAPYCMFYFSDDNTIATMGSTKPLDMDSTEPLDGIAAMTWKSAKQRPGTIRFQFIQPGMFAVEDNSGSAYFMIITLITEDFTYSVKPGAPKLKKGDLMVTYSNEKGASYLIRHLRRVISK